jgi:hypothetical protein
MSQHSQTHQGVGVDESKDPHNSSWEDSCRPLRYTLNGREFTPWPQECTPGWPRGFLSTVSGNHLSCSEESSWPLRVYTFNSQRKPPKPLRCTHLNSQEESSWLLRVRPPQQQLGGFHLNGQEESSQLLRFVHYYS